MQTNRRLPKQIFSLINVLKHASVLPIPMGFSFWNIQKTWELSMMSILALFGSGKKFWSSFPNAMLVVLLSINVGLGPLHPSQRGC